MSATGSPAAPNGFTLLEMLVVLAVAGLIAGIGFPQLQGQIAAQEWRTGVAATAGLLRRARAAAIRSGAVTAVRVAADGRTAGIDGDAPVSLPRSVIVTAPRPLLFYGDGSANGGEVTIAGARRSALISVAPVTGLLTTRTP